MISGEAHDFDDAGSEQPFGSFEISAAVVVKGGGDLNHSLQESFLRLFLYKPDFFPHFVRFEKFLGIEVLESAVKVFLFFGRFHHAE